MYRSTVHTHVCARLEKDTPSLDMKSWQILRLNDLEDTSYQMALKRIWDAIVKILLVTYVET